MSPVIAFDIAVVAQKVKVQYWGPVCIWKSGWVVGWISSRSGLLLELLTELTKKKSRKILIYNYAMHVSWLFCEYLFASPPKKGDMCRGKEADVNICTLASVRSFVFLCFWLFFSACRCKYLNLVMRFALPRCRVGKILWNRLWTAFSMSLHNFFIFLGLVFSSKV